jgi:uncharacterized membrane protein HdeD (DUF308 family)
VATDFKSASNTHPVSNRPPRGESMADYIHWASREDLRKGWLGFMLLGICLAGLGLYALGHTIFFTIASVEIFGWLLIIGGVMEAAYGFWRRRWGGFFLDLLTGLLYVAVGFMIVASPGRAAEFLTLLIAFYLIFTGFVRIFAAVSGQFHHWFWILFHGVITLILGIWIWRSWPISGFFIIGLFVAIDLILNGFTLVMLSLAARKLPAGNP